MNQSYAEVRDMRSDLREHARLRRQREDASDALSTGLIEIHIPSTDCFRELHGYIQMHAHF